VRWKYTNQDTGEPEYIWTTGKVVRVADGLAEQKSARAKKILPAGALLWAWEADKDFKEKAGEQWLILLPDKWNRHRCNTAGAMAQSSEFRVYSSLPTANRLSWP
jgi:hypothetical protein